MQSFPKIERKNISDQVFDMLKEYITTGKLAVGEKIPSENELTRMLGVSRPSVKAAVERLRAMGLIEVRAGDGSYVKEFNTSEYIENWADFVMTNNDISELTEFRRTIELASLELAIDRANENDIRILGKLSEQLVEAFKAKDYDKGAKYDMDFHLQICRCSKNKYFIMMYELIANLIFKQVSQSSRYVHEHDASAFLFDDHVKIYEAILKRNKTEGLELLSKHIKKRDSHIEAIASEQ